jgi:hypothetical protein
VPWIEATSRGLGAWWEIQLNASAWPVLSLSKQAVAMAAALG